MNFYIKNFYFFLVNFINIICSVYYVIWGILGRKGFYLGLVLSENRVILIYWYLWFGGRWCVVFFGKRLKENNLNYLY